MKKIGITRFLGTNCDRDIWSAVEDLGYKPEWLWYENQYDLKDFSAVFIPGGFSYGDYLRCGALAARSQVMKSVKAQSEKGLPVFGICNGFQILCEAGMLPGALLRNESVQFIDTWVELESMTSEKKWGFQDPKRVPIAHGEGRYFIFEDDKKRLYDQDQIWVKYMNNPNGSLDDIAGVLNANKNVGGLMPHPERAMESWMGSIDGRTMLENFLG
jgi:phosphoribosylformylglycinamidine synthase subunit PurQ / glutaminase